MWRWQMNSDSVFKIHIFDIVNVIPRCFQYYWFHKLYFLYALRAILASVLSSVEYLVPIFNSIRMSRGEKSTGGFDVFLEINSNPSWYIATFCEEFSLKLMQFTLLDSEKEHSNNTV